MVEAQEWLYEDIYAAAPKKYNVAFHSHSIYFRSNAMIAPPSHLDTIPAPVFHVFRELEPGIRQP